MRRRRTVKKSTLALELGARDTDEVEKRETLCHHAGDSTEGRQLADLPTSHIRQLTIDRPESRDSATATHTKGRDKN